MTMASSYFVSLSVLLLHFDWDFFFWKSYQFHDFIIDYVQKKNGVSHRGTTDQFSCKAFFFFFSLLKLRQSFIFMTQAILHTPNIRKKLQLPLICSMLTTNNKIKQKKKFFLIIFFLIGKYHISICWRFCPNPFGMERVTL